MIRSSKLRLKYANKSKISNAFKLLNITGVEMDADLNAAINILHRGTNSAHVTKNQSNNKILLDW